MSQRSASHTASVVIPTRNRLSYLKEAVASVERQTFGGWELLVVDDASTDDTRQWLASISDPRLRVVHLAERRHRAAARNAGLAEALGRYVLFLDDDDRLRPRALELLVRALMRHPDAVAACGGAIVFDERGHRRRPPHVMKPHLRILWPAIIAGWIVGTGQVMYRTGVLRSLGGWNESLTAVEDFELSLRASRLGAFFIHPYAVQEYRRHSKQWFPVDHVDARNRIVRSFLDSLPVRERGVGENADRTRAFLEAARKKLHSGGDPGQALRLFVAAYRASPAVVLSPMFRVGFIRGVSQAFVARLGGHNANRLVESSRRTALRILRRTPGQGLEREMVQDPTIRDASRGK